MEQRKPVVGDKKEGDWTGEKKFVEDRTSSNRDRESELQDRDVQQDILDGRGR
jgi:hypothetical protein